MSISSKGSGATSKAPTKEELTERLRVKLLYDINSQAFQTREEGEARHGKLWGTQELQEDFTVLGFCAPMVIVIRKSDSKKGTLTFQHHPRWYFDWLEDSK